MKQTIRALGRSLVRATFVLSFSVLAACAAEMVSDPAELADAPSIAETQQSVVGGTTATDCQWPSTVRVDPAQCTGTLIHPRVVTTAAHCMTGTTATIGFGTRGAPGSFSVSARCVAGARGSSGGNTGRDWAYCILPEDPRIAQIPPTPPLVGCEAMLVKPGSSGWVVGYGSTTARGRVGVKRQVEVKINQFNKLAPGTIDVGDRYAGACHGDSGGPLYVRVVKNGVDYGLRTMGSTSGAGGACDCTCSTTYVNIENHIKAIERNEGIDVTPCTDAQGNWDPSPACSGFESAPQSGAGTFPACTVARTMSPIESCGAGVSVDSDAGSNGGALADGGRGSDTADAGTRGDAAAAQDGAARDAATQRDSGAEPAQAEQDAAVEQGVGPAGRDAAIRRDAGDGGSAQRRDAASDAEDDSTDSEDDDSAEEEEEEGSRDYSAKDSGCSALRTRGGFETLALVLFALALRRARRRSLGAARCLAIRSE